MKRISFLLSVILYGCALLPKGTDSLTVSNNVTIESSSLASPTSEIPLITSIPEIPDFSDIHLINDELSNYNFGYNKQIYALDIDKAFLFGGLSESGQSRSLLLRTENGGQSWEEEVMEQVFGSAVLQIYFIDGGIGWATVMWVEEGPGKLFIYHTTDYGKSWHRLSEIQKDRWWGTPTLLEFGDEYNGTLHLAYNYYGDVDDIRIGFLTTNDIGLTWQETGSYPLDRSVEQLDNYIRDYNITLYPSESKGLDGCRWRVDEYGLNDSYFTVSRQVKKQNNWDIVSILPIQFKYFDGQVLLP